MTVWWSQFLKANTLYIQTVESDLSYHKWVHSDRNDPKAVLNHCYRLRVVWYLEIRNFKLDINLMVLSAKIQLKLNKLEKPDFKWSLFMILEYFLYLNDFDWIWSLQSNTVLYWDPQVLLSWFHSELQILLKSLKVWRGKFHKGFESIV